MNCASATASWVPNSRECLRSFMVGLGSSWGLGGGALVLRERGIEVVGGALGLAAGREDRALVGAQDLQPVLDVAGMAQLAGDAVLGAEESGGHFGDEFLGRVSRIAEALAELARQARGIAGPEIGRAHV